MFTNVRNVWELSNNLILLSALNVVKYQISTKGGVLKVSRVVLTMMREDKLSVISPLWNDNNWFVY